MLSRNSFSGASHNALLLESESPHTSYITLQNIIAIERDLEMNKVKI